MFFKIDGQILDVETIASGKSHPAETSITKALWWSPLEKAEGNGSHQTS